MFLKKFSYCTIIIVILFTNSCRTDKYEPVQVIASGYPADVDAIITKKCATAGCHNTTSKSTAANLDLSTHAQMMEGNNIGATIVPFAPRQSPLLFFVNTDSLTDPVLTPNMPYNPSKYDPLSKAEYLTLKNWVAAGAPDKDGKIPFAGNPNRQKFYVVNQGCDLLSVFDSDTRLIMRYKELGLQSGVHESPHNVKITPDGKYVVVSFLGADIIQMFSAETDELVASIPIGGGLAGGWNTLAISSDSKMAYAVDYNGGRVAFVDLVAKTSTTKGPFSAVNLHGVALNATDDTLYITENSNSNLWMIPVNDILGYDYRNVRTLIPGSPELKIHEIAFTPDFSKYFITCENVNQVWVFNHGSNFQQDVLDTFFNVPAFPQEIAFSKTTDNVFITCQNANTFSGVMGAVEVINYKTLQHVATLEAGWQPHGITVDDKKGLVYVVNRNADPNGPPPHHGTCGRNGWLSTFDLHTLQRLPGSPELSGDPYQVSVRP